MGSIKGVPHQKINTWWAMLRIDRGVSISKLSSDIEIPIGALTTYFSGEHIPREYAARKICLYFDIDYEFGKSKFVEAHNSWNTRHSAEWFAHDKQRESEYHRKYNNTNAIALLTNFFLFLGIALASEATIVLKKSNDPNIINNIVPIT